jgi:hypothetical protein
MRIGIVRESMVYPHGSKAEEPIVSRRRKEIKTVLGAGSGTTLVESSDPLWTRDPDIEAMTTDFRRALARLVPLIMPDLCSGSGGRAARVQGVRGGDRADRVHAREVLRHGTMQPIDYCVELAEGRIAAPVEPRHRDHPGAGARDGVRFHSRST